MDEKTTKKIMIEHKNVIKHFTIDVNKYMK